MRNQLLAIALFITTMLARPAFATDSIDIDVDTQLEPAEAIGLVVSDTGTAQKLKTSWKRINDAVVTVTVPLENTDRGSGVVVTAMIVTSEGEVAFGNTKPAYIPQLSPSMYSLPICPQRQAPKSLETQTGLVQSLMDVRSARRSFLQLKLSNTLQGDFLKKLSSLERGFGLERGDAIDPKLHPLELEDRLSRLEQAIVNYRSKKSEQSSSDAASAE